MGSLPDPNVLHQITMGPVVIHEGQLASKDPYLKKKLCKEKKFRMRKIKLIK
jgi:hypothetical protein